MTMTKAIVTTMPSGVDIRVGWDEDEHATDEEKDWARELGTVITMYLKMKEKSQAKKVREAK